MTRLALFSQWAQEDFCDQNNKEHRHVIDFDETSEQQGFGIDDDQLAYLEPWQFAVCPKTSWRVHGFIAEDTFFIVWLDPLHNLYPIPGGGVPAAPFPQ